MLCRVPMPSAKPALMPVVTDSTLNLHATALGLQLDCISHRINNSFHSKATLQENVWAAAEKKV